jgi:hypothetical protein
MDQPLSTMGLDSLMAIELRTKIEGDLHVLLPIATLFKGPTVRELAGQLLGLAIGVASVEAAEGEDWEVLKL